MSVDESDVDDAGVAPALPDPWMLSRLSWGSVFAGFFVAAALHLMLALVAVSFGMHFEYSAYAQQPVMTMSTAGGIVWAVSSVIALWVGGWIAGRTAGHGYGNVGGLHGVVVWGLSVTLASLLVLGQAQGRLAEQPEALANRNVAAMAAWSFLVLALGAFAAGWGGRCGARRAGYFHRLT